MKLSRHAEIRIKQRGVLMSALDIIWTYGRECYVPGGAVKYFFGNYEHRFARNDFKERLQVLDKAKGGTIVLTADKIITVYKN